MNAPDNALTLLNMFAVQSDPIGGSASKLATCSTLPTVCQDNSIAGTCTDLTSPNGVICSDVALSLGQKLQAAGRDREKMAQLMEEHWEQIYELANKVEERIIRTTPPSAFPEPIVERPRVQFPAEDSTLGHIRRANAGPRGRVS